MKWAPLVVVAICAVATAFMGILAIRWGRQPYIWVDRAFGIGAILMAAFMLALVVGELI